MGKKDVLLAKGMQLWGRHGCADVEKKYGQKFIVDVEVAYDMDTMCQTDSMDAGISYGDVYSVTEQIVTTEHYNLIQTLARRIAEKLQSTYEIIEYTRVTIKKPFISFPGFVDYNGVTFTKYKSGEETGLLQAKGMKFWGRCGFPEEKAIGEEYMVDVEVSYDMKDMYTTDDINRGLSFTTIFKITERIVTTKQFNMIQTLAHHIAEAIKAEYNKTEYVKVTVKKPNVQIKSILDYLAVTIVR
ncbi:MAG: dihydroneopterin aldolase [Zhaonellaceae bacterium]|jgi:dihydroneopterin aldolase|nr:dihydroneopterin aldolase [Clostridia bacterium]